MSKSKDLQNDPSLDLENETVNGEKNGADVAPDADVSPDADVPPDAEVPPDADVAKVTVRAKFTAGYNGMFGNFKEDEIAELPKNVFIQFKKTGLVKEEK